jgi:hypothetical protein
VPIPEPADEIKARSDAEARNRYLRFLQQSLCVFSNTDIWRTMPVPENEGKHAAFTEPEVTVLPTLVGREQGRVYLRATQRFTYADGRPKEHKVSTQEYACTVWENADLSRQVASWEWQPEGGTRPDPHAHVKRGCPEHHGLGKLHIPTGRVAYEQVLYFLMTDLGAVPVAEERTKDLDDSLRRFRKFKTW